MPWSSQIDEACDKLASDGESEGDMILVSMARLSRIIVSATEIFRRVSDDAAYAKTVVLQIGPLEMALNSLKATFTAEQLGHGNFSSFPFPPSP